MFKWIWKWGRRLVVFVALIAIVGSYYGVNVPELCTKLGWWYEKLFPDKALLDKYQEALDQGSESIQKHNEQLALVDVDVANTACQLRRLENVLAEEEQLLAEAQGILGANRPTSDAAAYEPTVEVGGKRYSWNQVVEDTHRRVQRCEGLREDIGTTQASLAELRREQQAGWRFINDKKEQLQQLQTKLTVERARLATLRAQEAIDEEIRSADAAKPVELAGAGLALQRRVAQREANVRYERQLAPAGTATIRTWPVELNSSGGRTAEALERYFSQYGKRQPEPKVAVSRF